MAFTRRQFFGMFGMLGLSSCARVGLDKVDMSKLKPDISMPRLPRFGEGKPYSFVTINDTHLVDARSVAIVNRAVNQINEIEDLAFVVALGDIANDAQVSAFRLGQQAFDRLEVPCWAVPGNHDYGSDPANSIDNYLHYFEDAEWREQRGDWVFIGFNSCNEQEYRDVIVPQDRLDWLQYQLDRINPERPIALLTHHPLNPNTAAYRLLNADDILALFEGHNLKLVSSGHFHGNQVEEQDGVLFITTACCSTVRNNHDNTPGKGYRVYHIDGAQITHEFVTVQT